MRIKNILILTIALGAFALGINTTDAYASTGAGVGSIISDCLSKSEGLVVAQKTNIKKRSTINDDSYKICGYTNLGIANVDNYLNVRKSPSESGEIVGKMPAHAGCEVLAEKDGWYYVISGKVEGYVNKDYLLTGDSAQDAAKEYVKTIATVTTDVLYVREEPNTDCKIYTFVPMNEELEVLEELDNGWIKIEMDDDEAYVSGEFVRISDSLPKAATIKELRYGEGYTDTRVSLVQYALQFVGNRYVWGGTSLTNGIDCSGFTMQVYRKFGVSLPHYSGSQPSYGKKIKASAAQPGDLFFYGKNGRINHVAIYIGGGQVVHASSAKTGIKISNAYYRTPICVVSYL